MLEIKENDNRFYLAPSKIPDAGLGVFAACPIKKDEFMDIVGVKVKRGSIADKCTHYANSYKFALQPGANYTDLLIPMGFAAIVNHGTPEKRNCDLVALRNKKLKKEDRFRLVYQFIKDVEKDEEILGNYGEGYARTLAWVNDRAKIMEDVRDEWQTFISYGLYNLQIFAED